MQIRFLLLVHLALLTNSQAIALDAPAAMVPPGLGPGSDFYIIFVTSGNRNALSSNIADYNAFVNAQADNFANKGTNDPSIVWRAVVGTGTTVGVDDQCDPYAGDTLPVPIYNLGGQLVANDRADMLDGSLQNGVNFTESGAPASPTGLFGQVVWTGCHDNGVASALNQELGGIGNPPPNVISADPTSTTGAWLGILSRDKSQSFPIYGVSPKLTVPGAVSGSVELVK